MQLWPWMGWMSAICDAHKKKLSVELLYNSVKTGSQFRLETRPVGERAVEKARTKQGEPSGPRLSSRGLDKLEIRCGRENQHPERLGPQAPGWAAQENKKETLMAIRVGVNMLQFCSVSNSLSHTTLSIKWEVYFSKRLCCSSLLCRCYDSACICRCRCIVCLYSWSCLGNNCLKIKLDYPETVHKWRSLKH